MTKQKSSGHLASCKFPGAGRNEALGTGQKGASLTNNPDLELLLRGCRDRRSGKAIRISRATEGGIIADCGPPRRDPSSEAFLFPNGGALGPDEIGPPPPPLSRSRQILTSREQQR